MDIGQILFSPKKNKANIPANLTKQAWSIKAKYYNSFQGKFFAGHGVDSIYMYVCYF